MSAAFRIESTDLHAFDRLCVEHLQERGFAVYKVGDGKEIPQELCRRLQIPLNRFGRRTRLAGCPPFEARRDESGRVRWLRSNPALEEWLRRDSVPRHNSKPATTHTAKTAKP